MAAVAQGLIASALAGAEELPAVCLSHPFDRFEIRILVGTITKRLVR